jgi:PhnB protein
MMVLNPYLVFNGSCEEAFTFYKEVFGGKILFMGRYKDVPQEGRRYYPNSMDEKIMHATLEINSQITLMGCDNAAISEQSKAIFAKSFYLYVRSENQGDAYRIFEELSAGGKITMPITQTFWSSHYGMVIDKFGIHWKITFDPTEKNA